MTAAKAIPTLDLAVDVTTVAGVAEAARQRCRCQSDPAFATEVSLIDLSDRYDAIVRFGIAALDKADGSLKANGNKGSLGPWTARLLEAPQR